MMKYKTTKIVSYMLIIFSISTSMFSKSLFMIWMTLEISMIMFLPLSNSNSQSEINSLIKYFIIQSLSSNTILLSSILMTTFKNNTIITNAMMLSLMLKLGLFPFHNWYFQTTENISLKMWVLINSTQKIIPLIILKQNLIQSNMINLVIIMNSLFSMIEMFNQSSIRWMLNSSSINHMSWILLSMNSKTSIFWLYISYYMASQMIMWFFLKKNMNIYILTNFKQYNNLQFMTLSFIILNLMGLPPFMIFFPKIFLIFSTSLNLMIMLMIICNMIMIFMYIKIFMINFLKMFFQKNIELHNFKNSLFNNFIVMVWLSIYTLPLIL